MEAHNSKTLGGQIMKKTEKKQFKELSEEELKDVTGGGYSKGEHTCPDGRAVSSFSQCFVYAEPGTIQKVVG